MYICPVCGYDKLIEAPYCHSTPFGVGAELRLFNTGLRPALFGFDPAGRACGKLGQAQGVEPQPSRA